MSGSIAQYMVPNPINVKIDSSLKEIMQTLENHHVSHLLVMEYDHLKGVISKSDILRKTVEIMNMTSGQRYSNIMLNTIKAKDIMSDDVSTVDADDSVENAIEILVQKGFHCLPVMEGSTLVGIVTFYDLLKAFYNIKV